MDSQPMADAQGGKGPDDPHQAAAGASQSSASQMQSEEEDWNTRAWELFVQNAHRGQLTVDNFVTFAGDMGVDCDPPAVVRFMKRENIEKLTFSNSLRLLELFSTAFADEIEVDEAEVNMEKVAPWTYVWKFWLLFNATIIFLLIAGCITGLMAIFWLDNALSRQQSNLGSLQKTLSFFSDSVASIYLEVSEKDLEDQVMQQAKFIERMAVDEVRYTNEFLNFTLLDEGVLLNELAEAVMVEKRTSISQRLNALYRYHHDETATRSSIIKVLQQFGEKESWSVVVVDLSVGRSNQSILTLRDGNVLSVADDMSQLQLEACRARFGQQEAGMELVATGIFGDRESVYFFQKFSLMTIGVCISLSKFVTFAYMQEEVVAALDEQNQLVKNDLNSMPEIVIGFADRYSRFDVKSKKKFAMEICKLGQKYVDVCNQFQQRLKTCWESQCNMVTEEVVYYNSEVVMTVMTYLPKINAVIAASRLLSVIVETMQQRLISGANTLNTDFVKTTEIVWSTLTETGIIPQATNYRFSDSCLIPCERIYESSQKIIEVFRTKSVASGVYPDYTLRPVVGASAYLEGEFNLAITIERDVSDLREVSLKLIVDAIDILNEKVEGSTEIMLMQKDGMPPTKVLDPKIPCNDSIFCVATPQLGVLLRSDCVDCLRMPELNETHIERYLTKLRFIGRCPEGTCSEDSQTQPNANKDLTRPHLDNPKEQTTDTTGQDYSGVDVLFFISYVVNFSTFIIVKRDVDEIMKPIVDSLWISIGIVLVVVVLGVVTLILLSRRTLNKIEKEWQTYKQNIEMEKGRFDVMIQEIIPPVAYARYERGQRTVTDLHNFLSFASVDVVAFTERCKQSNPRQVIRSIAYYFTVFEACARRFQLHRLKCFGDVAMFVAGLSAIGKQQQERGPSNAFGAVCFAGYLTQLFSSLFSHFPQRLPQLTDLFRMDGEVDEAAVPMQPVRIGLHSGSATSGLVDHGGTPYYELYGASLSLTQRMQATAPPGKIHASSTLKELLEMADSDGIFEFDNMKKMVTKGHGTISSFPLKSLCLPIDELLLHKLKIEHSQRFFDFRHSQAVQGLAMSKVDSSTIRSSITSHQEGSQNSNKDKILPKKGVRDEMDEQNDE